MELNYPDYFYKYLPKDTPFFNNPALRVTQREVLNDPFEQSPSDEKFLDELTTEEAIALKAPFKDNSKCSKSLIQKIISKSNAETPTTDFEHGTICFSETYDNLLMWSHYGSEHQGFVVAIDPQHFLEKQKSEARPSGLKIRRVMYRESRPINQSFGFKDYGYGRSHRILSTKSTHWSYEQEWRIQNFQDENLKIAKNEKNEIKIDSYNKKIQLYEIPKEFIKIIIIGARCPTKEMAALKSALATSEDWRHVHLKLAVPDPLDFRLRFLNINVEDLPEVPGA
ncbi:Protein of unknown function (DUF2971) [Acidovorax sp. 56]|uniref:DUF2971 domain-containing protein n=1 Tax=Acidovorax sp. 56 TaxID=2035205 RepID=UPI000C162B51|nr:DUF2971 domain-containing protein [Acidovorax sp. 56]PIF26174.1 Protein of unknown function (DUF2971) [Acidovorax sp. 56]